MFDFHTHILPHIDDGSEDIEMSLEMLKVSAKQGVTDIVLTPHFYPDIDSLSSFVSKRQTAIDSLKTALLDKDYNLNLYMGAEVAYFQGISYSDNLNELCINDSNLMLIEMPFVKWNDAIYYDIHKIVDAGITPIIAHIERYKGLQNIHKAIDCMREIGALIQVSTGFFLDKSTEKKAIKMLKRCQFDLIGSDTHNLTGRAQNTGLFYEKVSVLSNKDGSNILEHIANNEAMISKRLKPYIQVISKDIASHAEN